MPIWKRKKVRAWDDGDSGTFTDGTRYKEIFGLGLVSALLIMILVVIFEKVICEELVKFIKFLGVV